MDSRLKSKYKFKLTIYFIILILSFLTLIVFTNDTIIESIDNSKYFSKSAVLIFSLMLLMISITKNTKGLNINDLLANKLLNNIYFTIPIINIVISLCSILIDISTEIKIILIIIITIKVLLFTFLSLIMYMQYKALKNLKEKTKYTTTYKIVYLISIVTIVSAIVYFVVDLFL